ncbi:unnamed protein product [Rotaria magnacalcarata]|uniref:Uncharacterized protein n=3 Tax=Rotaria magnacalcarata TaxID=392030 RepID=A0A815VCS8_9BILA|nr:unnamed protein product [Rotaria magnacalcarata]CAF4061660.1 unnamed protein product [Rotaria magnacalcarata]CAF5102139.1 unnamed protein product [Rotaria magnacalcarata]
MYKKTFCQTHKSIFSYVVIQASLNYTTVVTFGDSMSDTGNAYRISNHTWPPVPPFNSNGSFADGLLWNQVLTEQLLINATLHDYACDSATTESELAQSTMDRSPNLIANYSIRNSTKPPSVQQQIFEYINAMNTKPIDFDQTLYVIWVGINNYNFNTSLTPLQTVESIIKCLNLLIFFGTRQLVIINEPPFDRFPAFRNKNTTNVMKYLYLEHNKILSEKINETYLSLNSRLSIRLFDSHTFISMIMNDYRKYGFENLDNCWDTETKSVVVINCQDITKRIFTDEYHLTSAMQTLLAKEFYMTLTGSSLISKGIRFLSIEFHLLALLICKTLLLN